MSGPPRFLYWPGMEADAEAVRAVVAPALEGMDEPTLDYLAALIAEEDGGPTRPLAAELVPFLAAAGIEGVVDEAAAGDACARLEALLREAFPPGAAEVEWSRPAGTLLSAPVCLGASQPVLGEAAWLGVRRGVRSPSCRLLPRGTEEEEAPEERGRVKNRAEHDGVPLSIRKDAFVAEGYGLQMLGAERPRQKNPCGLERPLGAQAQLKIRPSGQHSSGRTSATALRLPATILLTRKQAKDWDGP
mmetsp:Transcript_4420/g.12944  ORF Transcript_4420/g.12944 Transcript_4420/m.12944 type:complete len:246 (-) Transcript_4420:73-810(-)